MQRSVSHAIILAGLLLFGPATGHAADAPAVPATPPPIVLGLAHHEADKFNVEFQKYGRLPPALRKENIQLSLCEFRGLASPGWTEDAIYGLLKAYHVVQFSTPSEGVYQMTPELAAHAKVVGAALVRYVSDGGGLLIQPVPVRYPNSEDEKYWNLVFAPLGMQMLHEGVFDATRAFEGTAIGKCVYWFTRNTQPHPVTAGIACLALPRTNTMGNPGIVAMQYSPDWQTIVRGEKEARSYLPEGNAFEKPEKEGMFSEAPPVVAVRTLGKGRVLCYPISPVFTGANYGNPLWANVVEAEGDKVRGVPSDGLKLQINAYRWLAAPVLGNPEFGTCKIAPYQPVQFPPKMSWDTTAFAASSTTQVRGIFGLHSAFSDGRGTVAEFAAAGKAAGLGVIVFSDPLEKLTPETLAKLKADCAAASKESAFYACPGFEFTDGIGNRWAMWGDKLQFPEASFTDKRWTYTQWDGQRVRFYGKFADQTGLPGSALLDYQQLRANGAHPESLWWFYHYLPFVYENGKLIADNYGEYLFGLRDLRWSSPVSFTRIFRPAETADAAKLCFTGFRNLETARKALNTRCASYWVAQEAGQYVSQGPEIRQWEVINSQMENHWAHTRGAQRIRLRFTVTSEAGIAEVKVHDADKGALRRFAGNGAKELAREFELVHDKQRDVTLEVIDTNGRRAVSAYYLLFCHKQSLARCGDNLNILGSCSMCWIPDRHGMVQLGRYFNNGAEYSLEGADSSAPVCPQPSAWGTEQMYLKDVGTYPKDATVSKLMDIRLASYNLQVVDMRMDAISETWDNEKRPGPALCTVPKDLGPLEYYERRHTLISPMDRVDFYTVWNYRRPREGIKDYKGALNWHEGEIRFKKDVVLQGKVPIPLVQMRCPIDVQKGWGTTLIATDADGTTKVRLVRDVKENMGTEGRLRPGGYIAQMPTLLGYEAFLAPAGSDYAYTAHMQSYIIIGLGREGQEVKAGTVMPYRFAFGAFPDPKAGNELLEDTVRGFNLGGGQAGYPIDLKVGECEDAAFLFTAKAKDGEARFKLGPRNLMIDLPIRVRGLEDNGCAAVFSTKRPWFRFVAVAENCAWFQEPVEQANDIWVGNLFRCDNPAVKITAVLDGQADNAKPFLELHNPTAAAISATLRSPASAPVYGGLAAPITIPAGDSIRLRLNGKQVEPM